jgi:hypothetical protein
MLAMKDQSKADSEGVKVSDALDLYWDLYLKERLPESLRAELKRKTLDELKELPPEGGGISLGTYGLEVYESGGGYYVDAELFDFVMERLRLEGVSSNRCRLQGDSGGGEEKDRE